VTDVLKKEKMVRLPGKRLRGESKTSGLGKEKKTPNCGPEKRPGPRAGKAEKSEGADFRGKGGPGTAHKEIEGEKRTTPFEKEDSERRLRRK